MKEKEKKSFHKGRREKKIFIIKQALHQSTYLRKSSREIRKTEINPTPP